MLKPLLSTILLSILILSCGEASCKYNETESKERANNVIIADSLNWGEPTRIAYSEKQYLFSYETPSPELELLGTRQIKVNCENGDVTFVLRH